jgi:membrane protein implicated in regulation of membrane protease activity
MDGLQATESDREIAMAWWAWITLGVLLLGGEIMGIDAAFFLVFIGLSAILVGVADLLGLNIPAWGEFLSFAVIAALSMVLFRRRIYAMMHKDVDSINMSLTGDTIQLTADLPPGDSGRAEYRGTTWTVKNIGTVTLSSHSHVNIVEVDGTTLNVS